MKAERNKRVLILQEEGERQSAITLAEGKKADIIMIDMHRPNMQPENNIVKNIVYSGSKENVKLTMIDGKILYENGIFFVGEEAEDIYKKANDIIRGMN